MCKPFHTGCSLRPVSRCTLRFEARYTWQHYSPTALWCQDIGGNDIQKQEIKEAVELPLTHHELYRQIGIDPPRGVLLYGPPGTGKTMLAKAVAHHTTAAFIRAVGSEFVQKYLGEVTVLLPSACTDMSVPFCSFSLPLRIAAVFPSASAVPCTIGRHGSAPILQSISTVVRRKLLDNPTDIFDLSVLPVSMFLSRLM